MDIDFDKYPLPKRMRHHTASNLYIPLAELKTRPDYYPPVYDKIDWLEYFADSKAPAALDIGCGKGGFLLEYSAQNPDKNVLGIEVRLQPVEWLKAFIEGEKISNCSILWYSVVNGLNFIENGTIDSIFYLFPDPWPKQKHHKRRAFNAAFLDEICRILIPMGKLYLATDVESVHEYHIETLEKHSGLHFKVITSDDDWRLPVTNKERFCRAKGIEMYRVVGQLRNSLSPSRLPSVS
ncbi:MAG: tRNA (guanine-N7-)-methyltransferase [Bacteroidota bacterium]|nr:tRNA (guanine-N7-)-methyltransferase [Bacteroidota bacterium]